MDRIPIQPKCGRSGFFWVVESVGGAYQLGWGSYRLVVSLVPIGGGKGMLDHRSGRAVAKQGAVINM